MDNLNRKIGILGGGQLGKMLCQKASQWSLDISILDSGKEMPAYSVCNHFTFGNFDDYQDVLAFGRRMDVVSIEIEHVNVEALNKLEQEGIKVYPQANIIQIIKDKSLQKSFYLEHEIPTSDFSLFSDRNAVKSALNTGQISFPFVQKICTGGYDGRGVQVIKSIDDLSLLFEAPSIVEQMEDIDKEISVIVARNIHNQVECFDAVEMVFDPRTNQLDYQICPAKISKEHELELKELSRFIITELDMVGILAIEYFITTSGKILVNEMAPRPHNSGHNTIESAQTSQYEQLIRCLLDFPLGSPKSISPSLMLNLVGEPDHSGPTKYEGIQEISPFPGVHVHLYGKSETRPHRKMGHITILKKDIEEAKETAIKIKKLVKVTT